jgi:hypothetical protein
MSHDSINIQSLVTIYEIWQNRIHNIEKAQEDHVSFVFAARRSL